MKTLALEHFRRPPERLNCAQAVLLAYQSTFAATTIPIASMKSCGAGQAPGGLCGALHAVCVIAPDKAERLKTRFAELTGSVLCKEIRRAKKRSCEFCVAESAQLLENELRETSLRPANPE